MSDDRLLAEAIRRHEERLARDPESLAFAQLADLYRKARGPRTPSACVARGCTGGTHYTTARLILAKTLLAEGQLEGALAEVDTILQTSPKDVQCHVWRPRCIAARAASMPRCAHLEKAVGLDPVIASRPRLLSLLARRTAAPATPAGLPGAGDDTSPLFLRHPVPGAGSGRRGRARLTRVVLGRPRMPRRAKRLEAALRARHDGEGEISWWCRPRSSRRGCGSCRGQRTRSSISARRKPGKGGAFRAHQAQAHAAFKVIDNTFRSGKRWLVE